MAKRHTHCKNCIKLRKDLECLQYIRENFEKLKRETINTGTLITLLRQERERTASLTQDLVSVKKELTEIRRGHLNKALDTAKLEEENKRLRSDMNTEISKKTLLEDTVKQLTGLLKKLQTKAAFWQSTRLAALRKMQYHNKLVKRSEALTERVKELEKLCKEMPALRGTGRSYSTFQEMSDSSEEDDVEEPDGEDTALLELIEKAVAGEVIPPGLSGDEQEVSGDDKSKQQDLPPEPQNEEEFLSSDLPLPARAKKAQRSTRIKKASVASQGDGKLSKEADVKQGTRSKKMDLRESISTLPEVMDVNDSLSGLMDVNDSLPVLPELMDIHESLSILPEQMDIQEPSLFLPEISDVHESCITHPQSPEPFLPDEPPLKPVVLHPDSEKESVVDPGASLSTNDTEHCDANACKRELPHEPVQQPSSIQLASLRSKSTTVLSNDLYLSSSSEEDDDDFVEVDSSIRLEPQAAPKKPPVSQTPIFVPFHKSKSENLSVVKAKSSCELSTSDEISSLTRANTVLPPINDLLSSRKLRQAHAPHSAPKLGDSSSALHHNTPDLQKLRLNGFSQASGNSASVLEQPVQSTKVNVPLTTSPPLLTEVEAIFETMTPFLLEPTPFFDQSSFNFDFMSCDVLVTNTTNDLQFGPALVEPHVGDILTQDSVEVSTTGATLQPPLSQKDGSVLRDNTSPTKVKTPPGTAKTLPSKTQTAPLREKRSPSKTQTSPVRKKQSPLRTQTSPLREKRLPSKTQTSPLRQKQSLSRIQTSPLRAKRSPLSLNTSSAASSSLDFQKTASETRHTYALRSPDKSSGLTFHLGSRTFDKQRWPDSKDQSNKMSSTNVDQNEMQNTLKDDKDDHQVLLCDTVKNNNSENATTTINAAESVDEMRTRSTCRSHFSKDSTDEPMNPRVSISCVDNIQGDLSIEVDPEVGSSQSFQRLLTLSSSSNFYYSKQGSMASNSQASSKSKHDSCDISKTTKTTASDSRVTRSRQQRRSAKSFVSSCDDNTSVDVNKRITRKRGISSSSSDSSKSTSNNESLQNQFLQSTTRDDSVNQSPPLSEDQFLRPPSPSGFRRTRSHDESSQAKKSRLASLGQRAEVTKLAEDQSPLAELVPFTLTLRPRVLASSSCTTEAAHALQGLVSDESDSASVDSYIMSPEIPATPLRPSKRSWSEDLDSGDDQPRIAEDVVANVPTQVKTRSLSVFLASKSDCSGEEEEVPFNKSPPKSPRKKSNKAARLKPVGLPYKTNADALKVNQVVESMEDMIVSSHLTDRHADCPPRKYISVAFLRLVAGKESREQTRAILAKSSNNGNNCSFLIQGFLEALNQQPELHIDLSSSSIAHSFAQKKTRSSVEKQPDKADVCFLPDQEKLIVESFVEVSRSTSFHKACIDDITKKMYGLVVNASSDEREFGKRCHLLRVFTYLSKFLKQHRVCWMLIYDLFVQHCQLNRDKKDLSLCYLLLNLSGVWNALLVPNELTDSCLLLTFQSILATLRPPKNVMDAYSSLLSWNLHQASEPWALAQNFVKTRINQDVVRKKLSLKPAVVLSGGLYCLVKSYDLLALIQGPEWCANFVSGHLWPVVDLALEADPISNRLLKSACISLEIASSMICSLSAVDTPPHTSDLIGHLLGYCKRIVEMSQEKGGLESIEFPREILAACCEALIHLVPIDSSGGTVACLQATVESIHSITPQSLISKPLPHTILYKYKCLLHSLIDMPHLCPAVDITSLKNFVPKLT